VTALRRLEIVFTLGMENFMADDILAVLQFFLLGRIVTVDETWVHYHQSETKKASKEWRHTSSPKPKKFRAQHLRERLC